MNDPRAGDWLLLALFGVAVAGMLWGGCGL